jgi:hypothetical protein
MVMGPWRTTLRQGRFWIRRSKIGDRWSPRSVMSRARSRSEQHAGIPAVLVLPIPGDTVATVILMVCGSWSAAAEVQIGGPQPPTVRLTPGSCLSPAERWWRGPATAFAKHLCMGSSVPTSLPQQQAFLLGGAVDAASRDLPRSLSNPVRPHERRLRLIMLAAGGGAFVTRRPPSRGG